MPPEDGYCKWDCLCPDYRETGPDLLSKISLLGYFRVELVYPIFLPVEEKQWPSAPSISQHHREMGGKACPSTRHEESAGCPIFADAQHHRAAAKVG